MYMEKRKFLGCKEQVVGGVNMASNLTFAGKN